MYYNDLVGIVYAVDDDGSLDVKPLWYRLAADITLEWTYLLSVSPTAGACGPKPTMELAEVNLH